MPNTYPVTRTRRFTLQRKQGDVTVGREEPGMYYLHVKNCPGAAGDEVILNRDDSQKLIAAWLKIIEHDD